MYALNTVFRFVAGAALLCAVAAPTSVLALDKAEFKKSLQPFVNNLKTATWTQTTWETDGDDEEYVEADSWWKGIDLQRLDVTKGRGEGRTVVLRGKELDSGWLNFDYDSRMVLSIRGNTMRQNGFIDDLKHILSHWDSVAIEAIENSPEVKIKYKGMTGLPSVMYINPKTFVVSKTESMENDKVVERYTYSKVVYNPELKAELFDN